MVLVAQKYGKPRRTIDFQPMNKFCLRESHDASSPFVFISSIPQHVYKIVLDAYISSSIYIRLIGQF